MDASQLPSSYSHIHFAFGQISSTFDVNLAGYQEQFEQFSNLTYFKRILSFGGWSFSTDLDSYPIFREGVTDGDRMTFAQNVIAFVERYDLDGVDFVTGSTPVPRISLVYPRVVPRTGPTISTSSRRCDHCSPRKRPCPSPPRPRTGT